MESDKLNSLLARGPPILGETNADYRARIAQRQAEILERRKKELFEQGSAMNPPAARIRIWERLHEVELPRDPRHRLLGVIAAQTGLSIEDVLNEQQQRTIVAPPA